MYRIIKPLLDLIIALAGFIILLPIFFIITVLLLILNRGSAFFTQLRPGQNCKSFKIIKFKTMNDRRDKYGNLLSDAERLTVIGKFVRKASLDEIPQLLNVIKGDMSLVGPRPLLMEYLSLYNDTQIRRNEVKPGITGWAQINGRNTISWEQKFEYDIWYVNNISFLLDFKILFLTVKKVIVSEGINNDVNITMTPFRGNNDT